MSGVLAASSAVKDADHRAQLRLLYLELIKMQRWIARTGQRLLVVFEGRDAAGKGATIKRIIKHLRPRGYRVVSLPKPTERERRQWYFQRFVAHLPARGEVVLFDRSWYNRAGLEPVNGFCRPEDTQAFLRDAPRFEELLVRDGFLFHKLYFSIDKETQTRRIAKRMNDPLKRPKLSELDLVAQEKWDEYTRAEEEMLRRTSTAHAPWVCVDANDKRRARLETIRHLLGCLDYPGKEVDLLEVDPRIVRTVPATEPERQS